MKSLSHGINRKLEIAEENIIQLEQGEIEFIQTNIETKRRLKEGKKHCLSDLRNDTYWYKIHIQFESQMKGGRDRKIFKETMTEKTVPWHIIIKWIKTQ